MNGQRAQLGVEEEEEQGEQSDQTCADGQCAVLSFVNHGDIRPFLFAISFLFLFR